MCPGLTINGGEEDTRMVIGNDVCIAVLGLVHLRVGILPCELLSRVNGLPEMLEMESEGQVKGGLPMVLCS